MNDQEPPLGTPINKPETQHDGKKVWCRCKRTRQPVTGTIRASRPGRVEIIVDDLLQPVRGYTSFTELPEALQT